MFVHFNNAIHHINKISFVDISRFVETGEITVHLQYRSEIVKGPEAVSVIMKICPSALEGKRAKFVRHAWAIHNLIGHPLMQILAWLKLPHLGIKIHDATVPNPITKQIS